MSKEISDFDVNHVADAQEFAEQEQDQEHKQDDEEENDEVSNDQVTVSDLRF